MENLDLIQQPWYYGKINRREAEENLLGRGEHEGSFLVRESQSCAGQCTISVLDWIEGHCHVSHFLITQSRDGLFYFEDDVGFSSIVELIQHYKNHPINVNFALKRPCRRELRVPKRDVNEYDICEFTAELAVDEEFFQEKKLYSGSFSTVWQGSLKVFQTTTVVAKIETDFEDSSYVLRHEMNMLRFLNHENIVRLHGVIPEPKIHVVFHYCGDVNLVSFLLGYGGSKQSVIDQLIIANQVASALEYCCKMKCVHRNVKAKSVIVDSINMKCRLASFKYSRTVDENGYFYEVTEDKELNNSRVRWMAIEAARHGKFSQASDVWSFAVLLFEIFAGGALPFAGQLTCKVIEGIENGFRCPKPRGCPYEIYELMQQCWAQDEKHRPSFREVKELLKKYMESNKDALTKLKPPEPFDFTRKHDRVKQKKTSQNRRHSPVLHPMSSLSLSLPQINAVSHNSVKENLTLPTANVEHSYVNCRIGGFHGISSRPLSTPDCVSET